MWVTDECLATFHETSEHNRSTPASPFRRENQIRGSGPSAIGGLHARSLHRIVLTHLQIRRSEVSLDVQVVGGGQILGQL